MLKVGDKFGNYNVVRLIGQGGMGSVFLLQGSGGKTCVAKILDPSTAGDHESRVRFLREAEIALKVKSPLLVETYDVGEDPETGLCYILMEYVGGGSLQKRLSKCGFIDYIKALEYTRSLALVLEEVCKHGIVHRDIKPDNILFTERDEIKLADLGIARTTASLTTITQANIVMGTPAYMSPEQMIDPHSVDIRSDIYSLGVVLFEMLVGVRPYHNATFMELMSKAMRGEKLPDIRSVNSRIPRSVAKLIQKMCAPKPMMRFASPRALIKAIDRILAGKVGSFKLPYISRTTYLIAGGVLGVAALAGLTVASLQGDPSEEVKTIEAEVEIKEIAQEAEVPAPIDEAEVPIDEAEVPVEEAPAPIVEEETPKVKEEPKPESVVETLRYTAKNGDKVYSAQLGGFDWYYVVNEQGEAVLSRPSETDANERLTAVEPEPSGRLVIPSEICGRPLVRLERDSLHNLRQVTEIELPDTLREIGIGTFADNRNLREINVGKDNPVLKIEDSFIMTRDGKKLLGFSSRPNIPRSTILVPNGVESISFRILGGSDSIVLPESVKAIEDYDFTSYYKNIIRIFFRGDKPEKMSPNDFNGKNEIQLYARKRMKGWEGFNGITVLEDEDFNRELESGPLMHIDKYEVSYIHSDYHRVAKVVARAEKFFIIAKRLLRKAPSDSIANLGKLVTIEFLQSDRITFEKRKKLIKFGLDASAEDVDNALVNLVMLYLDDGVGEQNQPIIQYFKREIRRLDSQFGRSCYLSNSDLFLVDSLYKEDVNLIKNYFRVRRDCCRKRLIVGKMSREDYIAVLSNAFGHDLFPYCNLQKQRRNTKVKCDTLPVFRGFYFMEGN